MKNEVNTALKIYEGYEMDVNVNKRRQLGLQDVDLERIQKNIIK